MGVIFVSLLIAAIPFILLALVVFLLVPLIAYIITLIFPNTKQYVRSRNGKIITFVSCLILISLLADMLLGSQEKLVKALNTLGDSAFPTHFETIPSFGRSGELSLSDGVYEHYKTLYFYQGTENVTDPKELDCSSNCQFKREPYIYVSDKSNIQYVPTNEITQPLSLIKRSDGKEQWAYRGNPAYFSTIDKPSLEPGWGEIYIAQFNDQGLLVNDQGKTLYTRRDANKKDAHEIPEDELKELSAGKCNAACQVNMRLYTCQLPKCFRASSAYLKPIYSSQGTVFLYVPTNQYLYESTLDKKPGDTNAVNSSQGYWEIVKKAPKE